MAEYVERVKRLLLEQSSNFMELDSICFPPIDFKDALVRGRKQLVESLRDAKAKGDYEVAASENFWTTFSFLVMQLHFRGSQEFFEHIEEAQVWAYLFYRTADIYADVVTHMDEASAAAEGGAAAVESVTKILLDNSIDSMGETRHRFAVLLKLILEQRAGKDIQWRATVGDCREVMTRFADTMLRERLVQTSREWAQVAGAAIAVALAGYLLYRIASKR
eukprot:m.120868 g.120868  ORF g.120868 m.120868 type:complete len:220 (-) comp14563_c0_seq1:71-730(-)